MKNWIWLDGPRAWVNLDHVLSIETDTAGGAGAGIYDLHSAGGKLLTISQPSDLAAIDARLSGKDLVLQGPVSSWPCTIVPRSHA